MTLNQAQAVWELCRQGFPLLADDAENRWKHGQPFEMRPRVKLPLHFLQLIERCNREAEELMHGRLQQERTRREAEAAAIDDPPSSWASLAGADPRSINALPQRAGRRDRIADSSTEEHTCD